MTIQNKNLFTKEQYLNFKAAWKQATNSERVKHYFTEEKRYVRTPGGGLTATYMKVRKSGWIRAEHHILYNLLRGKKPHTGFTLTTNDNKIRSGCILNGGYVDGMWRLRFHVNSAHKIFEHGPSQLWHDEQAVRRVERFLEPFNGTISTEDLAQIELPKFVELHSNHYPGKTIATTIVNFGVDFIDPDVVGMNYGRLCEYVDQLEQQSVETVAKSDKLGYAALNSKYKKDLHKGE